MILLAITLTMSVGRKLRKWRKSQGLSERAAARLAKVSQPTWRKVENDAFDDIWVNVARRLVTVCGGAVTLDDFVTK